LLATREHGSSDSEGKTQTGQCNQFFHGILLRYKLLVLATGSASIIANS
jgi:hypothetical protein